MLKTVLLVVAGLGAGLAISRWFAPESPFATDAPAAVALEPRAAASAVSPARFAELERALAAEIDQRTALEARVAELAAVIDTGRTVPPQDAAVAGEVVDPRGPRLREAPTREDRERQQTERLIAAGFPPDRADWIERRVEELRMAALQAQYEATREGRPFEPGAALAGTRTLRSEIGDAEYERYLQALGRPTSVAVRDVLASSPAERAGLQQGDEVISYGGERVFDFRDLNALTLEGNAGESVLLEVRRNGQTIQLVVPRGPVGITSGGFRGR